MGNFVFIISRGLEDPTRITRPLQLAKAAIENDHKAFIFLIDDGVIVAKKKMIDNVIAPTGDEAADHLQFLLKNKVPIYA